MLLIKIILIYFLRLMVFFWSQKYLWSFFTLFSRLRALYFMSHEIRFNGKIWGWFVSNVLIITEVFGYQMPLLPHNSYFVDDILGNNSNIGNWTLQCSQMLNLHIFKSLVKPIRHRNFLSLTRYLSIPLLYANIWIKVF